LHTQSLRRLTQSPIPQKGNIDQTQGKIQKEKEEHWEEQKIANEKEEMNEDLSGLRKTAHLKAFLQFRKGISLH
jgi:hypothetical protein